METANWERRQKSFYLFGELYESIANFLVRTVWFHLQHVVVVLREPSAANEEIKEPYFQVSTENQQVFTLILWRINFGTATCYHCMHCCLLTKDFVSQIT